MRDAGTVQAQPAGGLLADFSDGPFRCDLDGQCRVHLDRPMPFLVLNRHAGQGSSLARRIAIISPANFTWPASDAGDAHAPGSIADIIEQERPQFGAFLLISLYDLPRDHGLDDESPELEAFRFCLSASADDAAQAAVRRLEAALGQVCIDLRRPEIEFVSQAYAEPGVEALLAHRPGVSHISVGLPQNYRIPGEEGIYPQVFHELEITVFDALLQCVAAFSEHATGEQVAHYRSFGRSAFIEAAVNADRALGQISRSFDFLLGVSPINTVQAFERFRADGCRKAPVFRYRPLPVSPEDQKRRLYAIDIRAAEDPVLETLFREKQLELDRQLMMLQCRNTSDFRLASLMLYGGVEPQLLDHARQILVRYDGSRGPSGTPSAWVDCHVVRRAAEKLVQDYVALLPGFEADIQLREDIAPGLMVSGQSLLISTATRMRRDRMDALLQHEVSVHLLTCVNGNAQGLTIFGTGLAGYEGIQEGLGVFAEYAVGGMTPARMRLLAARVVAVDAMLGDADFVETFRLLHEQYGFSERGAFNIVARVFRSGGLTKDAIYLRGLKQVFDFIAAGNDLDPFWFGKIAERHVPVVNELLSRGMLSPPGVLPAFLSRPEAMRNIERVRTAPSWLQLI
ncbi:flavohemoglobin expression-modulating QEGLA motif protein [Luteimonas vadosa]|uniref:Flavohemoglobin expression-modulating QEGLA motif protein n=1 Tax=Luteimonas vadosa TaxID=1165507 RepID=A0ABP9E3Y2_9GAMM